MPFHADWYRERRPAAARRLYPQAAGGLTFVASPSHVVALSEQATVQWVWRIDDLDPSLDREAVARLSRLVSSASLRPAVVVGRQGEAALVIARMMAATRDGPAAGTAVLRALRATDGVLIWTASLSRSPAEGKAEGGQVQTAAIASSPAVKGSFVYAAAVRSSGSSDELLLVAFDLTDGSLIWETRLGGYTPALAGGRASAGLMWRTLPTPVVDDRAVYLATDAGAVIAVDRFGGAIRWIARYPTIADPDRFDGTPALVSSSQPGGVDATLVVAPRDSADLFVFAARDGRRLARSGQYSGLTLIGVESGSSPLALLAGREVAGVEVPSMKQRWRWAATGETTIHGVSAKAGAQVYVPTSVGFAALSTETGELIRGVSPAAANLRRLTRSEVGQGLLSSLNMVGAFEDDGSPRVSGDRPPQRVPQAPPLNQRPRDGRVPAQRANE